MHFLRSACRAHDYVQPPLLKCKLCRRVRRLLPLSACSPPGSAQDPRVFTRGGRGTRLGSPAPQRTPPGPGRSVPERRVISTTREPSATAAQRKQLRNQGLADGKVKWRPGCLKPLQ